MSCQPEPRLVCSVFICIKRNKATTARKAKPENPEWQSTNYWVISLLLHPALIYCLLGIFIESYKRQLQLFLQAKFNPTYLLSCERVIYLLCSSASSICSDSPDPYWLTKAHIVGATISPYLSVITEGAAMGTERKHSHICSGCDYVGNSGETHMRALDLLITQHQAHPPHARWAERLPVTAGTAHTAWQRCEWFIWLSVIMSEQRLHCTTAWRKKGGGISSGSAWLDSRLEGSVCLFDKKSSVRKENKQ